MRIIRSWSLRQSDSRRDSKRPVFHKAVRPSVAITIGGFDGVHSGHQYLLNELRDEAKKSGLKSLVFTFSNSHLEILLGQSIVPLLTVPLEKTFRMRQIGIDCLMMLPFDDDLRNLSAHDFIKRLLELFDIRIVVRGYDNFIGRDRCGDEKFFGELQVRYGIAVKSLNVMKREGEIPSSSLIKDLIEDCVLEGAQKLLGYPYSVMGRVSAGESFGKEIGFPTANIYPPERKLLPPKGVYSGRLIARGEVHRAAIALFRKTLGGRTRWAVEAHIPNRVLDLNGKLVTIEFGKYLREFRQFDDAEELKRAIGQDVERVINPVES